MNNQEKIAEIIYQSYRDINFVDRLKKGSLKYDFPSDVIMKRMNKKENLKILKELGYNFKIFSPGQHYDYSEEFKNIKLKLSCKISGGIINSYIYIYINNEKVNSNVYKENLSFIYRHLVGDMNAYITAFTFRDFDDFKNAMSDIIKIYEDFKQEFLKQMQENGLLKSQNDLG